ncbi:RNA polymerase sigma factor [Georgenia subflava]|uniref:RNA polymerase sigma factor n=1 Tax=Georgenia subflava TaxID=1622177 RepID=UPI001D013E18|nr:RNA polymerase sigma factor [Georgenia subflava]
MTSHPTQPGRLPNVQPFEQVVTEHAATVLRVCRAVVGPADADDAWSETFLAAMRAYPDLPADANVQAWLVTIARRKGVDILRARARHAVPVDEVPEVPTDLGIPGTVDDELWAAVRGLTARQREAIAYHHLAGMPYAEVAQLIGGSAAAVRRAAADGIQHLRSTLEAR